MFCSSSPEHVVSRTKRVKFLLGRVRGSEPIDENWKKNNTERHIVHTIVSRPNPKQWMIVHSSDLMMMIRHKTNYISSQSSQGRWVNWRHRPIYIVYWITERICLILLTHSTNISIALDNLMNKCLYICVDLPKEWRACATLGYASGSLSPLSLTQVGLSLLSHYI